jgi:ring-1,2-phenylacetyl-CoA epoxidase subunit PaaD
VVSVDSTTPADVWGWLAEVEDPEIPVLSVVDLGIVREVAFESVEGERTCVVTLTPTYSGCPATEVIEQSVRAALWAHGLTRLRLQTRLAPAWTTDWMSEAGRRKLRDYGIAPPSEQAVPVSAIGRGPRPAATAAQVGTCPRCGSLHTELISAFGSTPCKALHRCLDCLEPFDAFKRH